MTITTDMHVIDEPNACPICVDERHVWEAGYCLCCKTERPTPPIVEVAVYARRFSSGWYPVGSDTPIPVKALVEQVPAPTEVDEEPQGVSF